MAAIQNRPGAPCEAEPQPGVESVRSIPQKDWIKHRPELRRLKLEEKLRLAQIRELMATNHNFEAT